jgi:hypothetical protein
LGSHSCLIQLIIVFVLFLAIPCWGQDIIWSRNYGGPYGDEGVRLCETFDGGYIMVGNTESFGSEVQIYLVKTDSRGDTLWTRTFGGNGLEYGNSVRQTTDGGFIIGGWTTSFGQGIQVYLVKTDAQGNTQWSRTYGGSDVDDCITVRQTSDGGYILVGSTYSYSAGGRDLYLIKTNPFGQMQWSKTYGGIRDDAGSCVEQSPDGGYVVTGYTESFAPHCWVYMLKTDPEGDSLWSKALTPSGSSWSSSVVVQQTSDTGYIITGYCVNDQEPGDDFDFFLIKTDSQGDTIWTRTYDCGDYDWAGSVCQTYDGGYVVAGFAISYKSDSLIHQHSKYPKLSAHIDMAEIHKSGSVIDGYLIKTDSLGDALWTKNLGGNHATDVQQTLDSSLAILGGITLDDNGDFYLLKMNPNSVKRHRGDANDDRIVNVCDVVFLTNYLFKNGPIPEPLKAGDANCDLWIDIEDVIYLIRYLFLHGPDPGSACD